MERTVVGERPKPNLDDMFTLSIEHVYHYIRFYAFENIPELEKKNILMKIPYVKLRDPELVSILKDIIRRNDFLMFQTIIERNMLDIKAAPEFEKRIGMIIDSYFMETQPLQALDLLSYLLFYPNSDIGELHEFIMDYKAAKPNVRKLMVQNNMTSLETI
jgi:hypothetical protein